MFRLLVPAALALISFQLNAAEIRAPAAVATNSALEFIDTSFENASPLWYEFAPDGTIDVHLIYDHERSSPNRAAGHFHFQLHAKAGSRLTIEFKNLDNVWNSRPGSVARELKAAVISENGRDWKSVPLEAVPTNRVRLVVDMPGPRPLEIVRVGKPEAPYRVFIRARAHPWESGGNWVVEGLVARLLKDDAEATRFLQRYCLYVMPMANKDGVARGRTRFNVLGKDLNRNWDKPADAQLAPENVALEKWLEEMIRTGRKPHLALELHNDGNGLLHISRPAVPDLQRHIQRMTIFEELLRKHTWFSEGSTKSGTRNSGTLGEGWLERYGIDAAVHEFNCNWIAGLKRPPSARYWQDYGAGLALVFEEYFEKVRP
jgi:hypothetical protein